LNGTRFDLLIHISIDFFIFSSHKFRLKANNYGKV